MRLKEFIYGALIAGVFYLLITLSVGVLPLDRGFAQLLVFPLVIALFWWGAPAGIRVPRVVLALACLGALVSTAYAYVFSLNQRGTILFATLAEDSLKNETRIFRKAVSDYGSDARSALATVYESIGSPQQARSLFEENPRIEAVVWGSKRWVNVSFRQRSTETLGTLVEAPSFGGLSELLMVQSVPIIGLSYEPFPDTTAFLADLFEGLTRSMRREEAFSASKEEVALLEAAGRVAPWSNFAHRAYPNWVLGNRYLLAALAARGNSPRELRCAIDAYYRARGFLREGDNRELWAAIHNNLALALYAEYLYFGRKEQKKSARASLKQAIDALTQPNVFRVEGRASSVAAVNLGIMSGQDSVVKRRRLHKKHKHKKKAEKRDRKQRTDAVKNKTKKKDLDLNRAARRARKAERKMDSRSHGVN